MTTAHLPADPAGPEPTPGPTPDPTSQATGQAAGGQSATGQAAAGLPPGVDRRRGDRRRGERRGPTVGYLGWTGHHNLGDDAIRDALAASLPGVRLVASPVGLRETLGAAGRLPTLHRAPLLLGGGTVLGRRIWRLHLRQALLLAGAGPAHMLGAGVEDPDFTRTGRLSERRELARWPDLFARFDGVTVRGPRSAELLADIGVDATVIGDPALLLDPAGVADPLAAREAAAGGPVDLRTAGLGRAGGDGAAVDLTGDGDGPVLAVNLGVSDDLWGHDQARVVDSTAAALARLAEGGWRFRPLVANPADAADTARCGAAAGLPASAWRPVDASDPQAFLTAVAGCDVVLAERLHAGVLAARMAVPTVLLEYQPKCRDFLRSVGLGHLSARTDRLGAGDIIDLVTAAAADRATISGLLAARVVALRAGLHAGAAQVAAACGAPA